MNGFGMLILIIAYTIVCYAFLFINSGLKLLYRKLTKESKKWTFKDALRSWGFVYYDDMVTEEDRKYRLWKDWFSWSLFGFMFLTSPFLFFYYVFLILLRLFTLPILHFIGEK